MPCGKQYSDVMWSFTPAGKDKRLSFCVPLRTPLISFGYPFAQTFLTVKILKIKTMKVIISLKQK